MAYMSQENKAAKAPLLKAIFKQYGVKASLAVRHHSTLVINIKAGDIDFFENAKATALASHNVREIDSASAIGQQGYLDVNPYHYRSHFSGQALAFLDAVFAVASQGNHNRSDLMTDYHDVGWYIDVNVGQYKKPYQFTGPIANRAA